MDKAQKEVKGKKAAARKKAPEAPAKDSQSFLFAQNLLLGGVSAAISKTACAPIERVKLILQTQSLGALATTKTARQPNYRGIVDCFAKILKYEGALTLWRGNGVNVTRYFPMSAINFAIKEKCSEHFVPEITKDNHRKVLVGSILAGGISGCFASYCVYPLDLARTKMSADVVNANKTGRRYAGLRDCVLQTLKSEGVRGLFKGAACVMAGSFVFRGLWFGLYDFNKSYLKRQGIKITRFQRFLMATATTIIAGYACYPLDTIGRRMMVQSGSKVKLYKNSLDCTAKVLKNEGMRGIFGGSLSNAYRGIAGSLILVLFDDLKLLCQKCHQVHAEHSGRKH
jgi:solute carrier family 25 (mitochondrial adenine nucleotide translocator), member 4/5/6/31